MRLAIGWTCLAAAAVLGCSRGESVQDTPGESASASAAGQERKATGSPDNAASTSAVAPRTVLMVGTSLTAGLGLDASQAYPAVLQRMADSAGFHVHIENAGLSGETSAGALRRVDWLLRQPASLVVIETGANDGLRGLDIDSTRANLVSIIRKVHAALPDAPILLAQMEAPPNLGVAYTGQFHDMFPRVAREEGVTLVPFLLDGVAGIPRLNQGDGIHPTAEGARIVARNVWRALAPALSRVASRAGTG
jgi:acyl-CoA thioesterase I